jgi:hypothetical protein
MNLMETVRRFGMDELGSGYEPVVSSFEHDN